MMSKEKIISGPDSLIVILFIVVIIGCIIMGGIYNQPNMSRIKNNYTPTPSIHIAK